MKNVLLAAVLLSSGLVMGNIRITFHDGTIFDCNRVVQKTHGLLIVEKDGRRLSIKRAWIDTVEEVTDQAETKVLPSGNEPKALQPETGEKLVLTDDNVERTVPRKKPGEQKKKEEPKAPPVSINVISQQVAREGERVTFTGTLRNDLTETVNKLNMTVQALDVNGKVVAESTSMVAGSMAVGQAAPFSFQFTDPGNRITRFAFKFEGELGGAAQQ